MNRSLRRVFALHFMLPYLVSMIGATTLLAQEMGNAAKLDVDKVNEYRIGPADVLLIAVWRNEALTQTVTVRPDGKISFPLVNDIAAAGLTPAQLRELLTVRLTTFIGKPEVSVIVKELHSFTVSVLGEVRRAGRYDINNTSNVLDVLAQAGGINEFASRSRIFILRPDGSSMKRIPFDYTELLSDSGAKESFYVKPGDIVVVP